MLYKIFHNYDYFNAKRAIGIQIEIVASVVEMWIIDDVMNRQVNSFL